MGHEMELTIYVVCAVLVGGVVGWVFGVWDRKQLTAIDKALGR